jgi:hypothetical protein
MPNQDDKAVGLPATKVDMTLLGASISRPIALAWKSLLAKQGKTLTLGIIEKIVFDFEQAGEPPPPELAPEQRQFGPNGRRRRKQHVPDRKRD